MPKPYVHIERDERDPKQSVAVIANSIVKISNAFEDMQRAGLTQKAIVVLVQNMPGMNEVTRTDIKLVLDNLPRLKAWYVTSAAGGGK